jgi:thioredoxin-related protein
MKSLFAFFFSALFFISNAQSGYQIRIKTEMLHADSLFIKTYNFKSKNFNNFISVKFENDLTLKDKKPLDAGLYMIVADSVLLSEFLISDVKNQKFTFSFMKNDIQMEGSKENSANLAFTKKMMEFRQQERELNMEFQMMQQKGMPNSMMQAYVDTFFMRLNKMNAEKRVYQEKMIAENKGLLLATVIQCSMEAPMPPQEYYRDRVKLFSYLAEHLFDDFAWNDERLLNTPVLQKQFSTFAQQILPLEAEITIPIVLKVLNESKKNKKLYFAFFDFLEHEFGYYQSPYRDVLLYIEMIKDILNMPNLEETRKLFYKHELALITKNQVGEQAIDFNILMSNGDTTKLYGINAELLLIYFQNPDCPTCSEFREKMKNMESLYNAIASGKLKVITIYFEEKEELWRNYLKTKAFTNWMHGWNYDTEISEKRLYDIRNIPTIMLLDKNKRVIKKDIFPNELEDWLKKNL